MQTASAQAPAKAIFSGEHSIVAGQPALAIPLPLQTNAEITFEEGGSPTFFIDLPDFDLKQTLPWSAWEALCAQKHALWQQTQRPVVESPLDLVALTLWQFHALMPLPQGRWRVHIRGHRWQGRGLGSSASVIVALLRALNRLSAAPLADDALLATAVRSEHYVHGRSSGLDPAVIFHDAPLWLQRTATGLDWQPLDLPLPRFWLIDTGAPEAGTGECVHAVRQRFPGTHPIWEAFAATTETIRGALTHGERARLHEAVQTNHVLLRKIGVVPDRVNALIRELNRHGAAKISGAGSVRGDNAGMVLYFAQTPPDEALLHDFDAIAITLDESRTRQHHGAG